MRTSKSMKYLVSRSSVRSAGDGLRCDVFLIFLASTYWVIRLLRSTCTRLSVQKVQLEP